ncbi:hypothetical protein PENTCL1PPCAC_22833, partial [Pristionchus entomophagus]
LQRFQMGDDYEVKKMDVDVIVEDEIDLSIFRGSGVQSGEVLLPQEDSGVRVDEKIVSELTMMGFSRNGAVKAYLKTKGQGLEGATNWIMGMMEDPTLNDPPSQVLEKMADEVDGEAVNQLVSFGFTPHQARYALKKERDVNGAAEWLFSNGDSVPEEIPPIVNDAPKEFRDGSSKYQLVSFISHMGSSPHSGHYVCHAMRSDRWILFNDEKVAVSKNPPKQLAYLYLYKRI